MKRIVWLFLIAASIGFVTLNVSCHSQDKNKESQFYYYPKANVYYDVSKKTYIYSLNGGRSWESIADSSNEEPETLGKKIVLYSATDSIWKDNETHRKLYNGVLYNVANEDSAAAVTSNIDKVSEREKTRRKHKLNAAEVEKNNENKRPIKRFFEKLFGRHKKADKQE